MHTAREMREGAGCNTAIQKLVPEPLADITRPVLDYKAYKDNKSIELIAAFGIKAFTSLKVVPREMEVCEPDVEVKEHITCSDGKPGCQVFSLCPVEDENVWVCYASSALTEFTCPQKFNKHGEKLCCQDDVTKETTFKQFYPECGDFSHTHDYVDKGRFAKSDKLWMLDVDCMNTVTVEKLEILSRDPLVIENNTEFSFNCKSGLRAFDIDSSGTWVAVVEEPENPLESDENPFDSEFGNKVNLFKLKAKSLTSPETVNSDAESSSDDGQTSEEGSEEDSYGPMQDIRPMDVCFYTLGVEEFLLVADERDAIHVLRFSSGCLEFVRYLNPACPLIVRPTAMNVDPQGRLWVACQEGRILICTPCSP